MTPAVARFAGSREGRGWQQASTAEVSLCQATCAVVTAGDPSEKELWGQRRVRRQGGFVPMEALQCSPQPTDVLEQLQARGKEMGKPPRMG